jgi:hypothetical protein
VVLSASSSNRRVPLSLAPGQTARIDLRQALGPANVGAAGGLTIALPSPGLISPMEIVFDETTGLTAMMKLFEREPGDQPTGHILTAPMMALSQPDAGLGFPSGTTLNPVIFLRNATASPEQVSPNLNWRSESKSGTVSQPPITLSPGEVTVLALNDPHTFAGVPADAIWGTVNLSYVGKRADLIPVALSYDKQYRYGLQTPFSGALSRLWAGGMWHVDQTHSTLITTGNGGNEPTTAEATLFYNGGNGKYRIEKMLSPGQQLWLDLGYLVHDQVPDSDGHVLPPDTTMGSYELRDLDHATVGELYEGKLVIDKTYGHAAYGCGSCCGYDAVQLSPDTFAGPPDVDNDDCIYATDACTGGQVDVTGSGYGWDTADASIATLPTRTLHTVAVGSTTGSGLVQLASDRPPECGKQVSNPQQSVNVGSVKVTSANLEDNQTAVTLSGPSGASGTLEVIAIGVTNQPQITYDGGAAIGPGSYTAAFNRPSMPADTYSSVRAVWNLDQIPAEGTLGLTQTWWVQGNTEFTQYNTPAEASCSATQATAFVFNPSTCSFTQTSMSSQFISQAFENGTGTSKSYGLVHANPTGKCSGSYPAGASATNTFYQIASVTGACNQVLTGGSAVASYPSPVPGTTWSCGDDLLTVSSSNVNVATYDVLDYCPACASVPSGYTAHVDVYSASNACSLTNLPGNWSADTH